MKTKPTPNNLGDTAESPLFQENTHHCWVFQAGSREQDPGFNCKPAVCGQVCFPLLQSRPLLLGKSHTKVTISQEQRRVPAIRMLGQQVSRLHESRHGCCGMPATPQHPQPAAATTAGDIPGPSDSVLLCHNRAAGRAFSLSYPHNYSVARESIQVPDSPAAPRRMTHHHHYRQHPQKENVLLCPIVGLARMYPDVSPSLPGTAADHPHAPRRRKKRRGEEREDSQPLQRPGPPGAAMCCSILQVCAHSMHSDAAPERSQCKPSEGGKQNLLLIEGFWRRFN